MADTSKWDKYEVKETPKPTTPNRWDKYEVKEGSTKIYGFAGPGMADVKDSEYNSVIDFLRPMVSSGAAGLGAGVASPALYTGADLLMQKLKKEQKPIGEQLLDTALQATIGKLFNWGGKAVGAVRNSGQPEILKFAPTTSQAMRAEGIPGAGFIKLAEDTFAPGSMEAAAVRSGQKVQEIGNNLAGRIAGRNPNTVRNPQQMSDLILGELAPEQELKQVAGKMVPVSEMPAAYEILPGVTKKVPFATDPASLDKLIANPSRLQEALTKSQKAGLGINVRQDLAGYRLSRVLQDATDPTGKVNVTAARAAFEDPMFIESNKLLFNSTNRSNIEQFFKNAAFVESKPQGTLGNITKFALRGGMTYFPMRFLYSAMTGNMAGMASAAGATGLEIGGVGLAKLLTKPETARIMIRLAGAEPLGMSDEFAARMILRGLQGTSVSLVGKDGQKKETIVK